ncbi:SGNH/GDSL hydrolase family protein [Herbiconiux sp. CPCC 203386]|uniref:SGNH/GDSL hydrolase family protein n=1 Tax=Herbiconiux daphne TaxID=2970914 RepID=A0ABT2H6S1_9MICO|nr:SGNH/GDSL hydrolase family protein [Herbiconiux daphne]
MPTVDPALAAEARAADPDAPLVAFYGDSYTLGTGASDPALRWSTTICADRGWTEFNPSVNGLGFVNNRASTPPDYLDSDEIPQIIARDPDIVFVTMGLNDNFSMPERADAIQNAIATDFTTLVAALPDARIIVVEPFWYTDDRPPSVQTVIDWVDREAAAIGADRVPDASQWLRGHPEWMAADGLHPDDQGYAEMARRMDAALRELGL